MDKQKLIIVGLPGSGIDNIPDFLKKYKVIKYFTSGEDNIYDNFLYKYMNKVENCDINSIYDNNFMIMMYNSLQYNGSINSEGITIDEWEEKDYAIMTPYEFINLPIQYIKKSYIVWVDNNKEYIKSEGDDALNKYTRFLSDKYMSLSLFYNIIKDLNTIYFFNEPIERISGICNILLKNDNDINNILLTTLNK